MTLTCMRLNSWTFSRITIWAKVLNNHLTSNNSTLRLLLTKTKTKIWNWTIKKVGRRSDLLRISTSRCLKNNRLSTDHLQIWFKNKKILFNLIPAMNQLVKISAGTILEVSNQHSVGFQITVRMILDQTTLNSIKVTNWMHKFHKLE